MISPYGLTKQVCTHDGSSVENKQAPCAFVPDDRASKSKDGPLKRIERLDGALRFLPY